LTQLDAAWMAASAGVSVVIASGKAKDGVLQVTAGVTLSANLAIQLTVCSFFHLFMPLAWPFVCHFVCFSLCLFVSQPVFCLPISLYVLLGFFCQKLECSQGCMHIASQDRLLM